MSDPILRIAGLQKTYPNGFHALKGIDLSIERGNFFALLGPNGAGKSTTIGIVSSLVNKSEGHVEVHGFNLDTQAMAVRRSIGIMPQEFNINIFETLFNVLIYQAGYYGIRARHARQTAEKYLRQLDLWEQRHQAVRTLSGGMKRRLMVARAMMHRPQLLILDEPTQGIDIELRRQMWQFLTDLNNDGITILLTTHYLEEAERLCRDLAIINHGRIVEQGPVHQLLRQLQSETFVLNSRDILPAEIAITGYRLRQIDNHCLEVEVPHGKSLNDLFAALSAQQINLHSLRNKTNRLEEIFLQIVQSPEEKAHV